ncbi:GDSL esterase/lipase At1g29670-like [Rutidosis leptorrhynchoides]|uniref:GDSL esterase/lipase At1g29670-like n=1 Tax=Rutidosis leptorrhynchoides TaxID=125765 RepID=UPI003A9A04D2
MANYHIFIVLLKFGVLVVTSKPQVPCYFIFGDSLVDSGNNNDLVTTAKANYLPYGIDFPKGVTGRFTNGRTIADMIGELLGFHEFIPTYATVTDHQMSKGVNYASGGAGIRCETGIHLGDRISLKRQLCNHNTIVSRLFDIQRNITFTNQHLNKCIYVVYTGSNDYINNYLRPTIYTTSHIYTPYEYATNLIQQYSQELKNLYNLGGRKIVVFGLPLIGCAPAVISYFGTKGKRCVESINDAVKQFNDKLKPLVDELNHDNQDAKFTFINVSRISEIQNVIPLPNFPCCEVKADALCAHTTNICNIRALSIYFDGLHPTEEANNIIAATSYIALSDMDASPYDISHLIRL